MGRKMKITKMQFLLKATAVLIFMLFPLVTTGCNKAKQMSLAGKYVSERNPQNYCELKSNGTFFVTEDSVGIAGTYEVDGNQITFKTPTGLAERYKIEGNTVVDSNGVRWTKK